MKKATDLAIKYLSKRVCVALTVLAAMAVVSGCASSRPSATEHQYLDTATGVTMTGLSEPAIFYHDAPRLAANVRDYLYMGPVEMNRLGKYSYYLWVGEWSTIDRLDERNSAGDEGKAMEPIVVLLDGVPMELQDSLATDEKLRIVQHPYTAPVSSMRTAYMRVSRDQLDRIALANRVVIRMGDPSQSRDYKLWSGNIESFGSIDSHMEIPNSERLVKIR